MIEREDGTVTDMTIADLQPGLVVQDGRETLKVSTIYSDSRVTAQVVLPVPKRTTVRWYTAEQVALWRPVSDQKFNEYDAAYGPKNKRW